MIVLRSRECHHGVIESISIHQRETWLKSKNIEALIFIIVIINQSVVISHSKESKKTSLEKNKS